MDFFYSHGAWQAWDRLVEAGFEVREVGTDWDVLRVELRPGGGSATYAGEALLLREALVRALGAYLSSLFPRNG